MLESLMIKSQVTEPGIPTEIGTFWEGGYYTGKIDIGGKIYALILSPRSPGQTFGIAWKTTNNNTTGTNSLSDGWSNTQAMIAAGANLHPAAKYCHDLVINGYDDWYLPAVNELEMCYRAFKPNTNNNSTTSSGRPNGADGVNPASIPAGAAYTETNPSQTTVLAFRSGGSEAFSDDTFWTSSQLTTTTASAMSFNIGYQSSPSKSNIKSLRAVRKVLIG